MSSVSPLAKAAAITGVSLLLGLMFNVFFWGQVPGLSFPLFAVSIAIMLVALSVSFGRSLGRSVLWLLVPLVFFSSMVAFRASPPLVLLNMLATLVLLLLIARVSNNGRLLQLNVKDYGLLPFLPFKFVSPLARNSSELVGLKQFYRSQPLAAQIVKGVLLAVPLLVVFLLLFASADLVFQKYLSQVFNIHLDETTVVRTVLILLVTAAFTGAYAFIFGPAEKTTVTTPAKPKFAIGQVESSILLGSVGALFFLFILVQLAYLFGGASNISAQGFTYAEYARKGFFELVAVALLTGAMLWAADRSVVKTGRGHSRAFRFLSSALVAEVILIMVSAFKRLYMYEQAYGFTVLRLYSHIFVVFLGVVFVLMLIKILRDQTEAKFVLPVFITALVFLASLNLLNPDAFIVRQNLDRYNETGKLDAAYIGRASADAQAEIDEALAATTGQTHAELEAAVKLHDQNTAEFTGWQSWNYARSQK